VPMEGLLEFAMTCTRPERENPRTELSKAYAIVYNARRRRLVSEYSLFSESCVPTQGLLISRAKLL
jgi:hypothetical protein